MIGSLESRHSIVVQILAQVRFRLRPSDSLLFPFLLFSLCCSISCRTFLVGGHCVGVVEGTRLSGVLVVVGVVEGSQKLSLILSLFIFVNFQ
jgi:hypothetical protein